jgi:hypothetical protein
VPIDQESISEAKAKCCCKEKSKAKCSVHGKNKVKENRDSDKIAEKGKEIHPLTMHIFKVMPRWLYSDAIIDCWDIIDRLVGYPDLEEKYLALDEPTQIDIMNQVSQLLYVKNGTSMDYSDEEHMNMRKGIPPL